MRWLRKRTSRETWEVGRKRGVALPDDFVARTLAFVDGLPPEMKASMLGYLEAAAARGALALGPVRAWRASSAWSGGEPRRSTPPLKPYLNGSEVKASDPAQTVLLYGTTPPGWVRPTSR